MQEPKTLKEKVIELYEAIKEESEPLPFPSPIKMFVFGVLLTAFFFILLK